VAGAVRRKRKEEGRVAGGKRDGRQKGGGTDLEVGEQTWWGSWRADRGNRPGGAAEAALPLSRSPSRPRSVLCAAVVEVWKCGVVEVWEACRWCVNSGETLRVKARRIRAAGAEAGPE
jgi:hypothetical protein